MAGQVIRRDEADSNGSNGDPHEVWYYFNGREMTFTGNNGTLNTDYAATANMRLTTQGTGAFRNGATYGTYGLDLDSSYEATTSFRQGAAGGRYIVQGGETLQGIAQAIWGDASLWYKIAEANGLSGNSTLIAGQALTLPSGVTRSHNNASTFKPYDPAEALGNTSPTTPKPPKKNKCGMFGQVLVMAIAIAVVALTQQYEIFAGLGPVLGGAASAALGSVVSQGVGVATGIQDKFSLRSVALAGLTAGITAGVGQVLGNGAMFGSKFLGDVVRGAVGSAVTQGVAVATGLQNKFDWAGVAAAGISSGVGDALGRTGFMKGVGQQFGKAGAMFVGGMARDVANAATRSVISGSDFGDNMLAGLPDVIAQTMVAATQDGTAALTSHRDAQHEQMALAGIEDSGGTMVEAGATGQTTDPPIGVTQGGASNYLAGLAAVTSGSMAAGPVPNAPVRWVSPDVTAEQALANAGQWISVSDDPRYSSEADFWIHFWTEQGLAAPAPQIAPSPINIKDLPIPMLGGVSLDDIGRAGDVVSSALQWGVSNFAGWVESGKSDPRFHLQAIFAANFVRAGGNAIAAIPGLATNPDRTVTDLFWGTAGLVDRALTAEDISARAHASNAMTAVRNSTPDDWARIAGTGGGIVATFFLPNKFVPRGGAPSVEVLFGQNSLRLMNEGHDLFERGLASGDVVLDPRLSTALQRGRFVDLHVRRGNSEFRDLLGLDATTVRINQRLYTPNGTYSVPDLHFPLSSNSIDYSYTLKTANMRQITRIQQAAPSGVITIVPPAAVRPVYTIP
jgi:LysM repeat protein